MQREIVQAQEFAAHRRAKGDTVEQLMEGLERQFGDNFVRLNRGNVQRIEWVYEDSRPSVTIIEVKTC